MTHEVGRFSAALFGLSLFLSLASSACSAGCPNFNEPATRIIPQDRASKFEALRAKVEDAAKGGDYESILLGDSIAMLWPQELLDAVVGNHVLNAGIGGDNIANVLFRLQNTSWSKPPRILAFVIGTNDTSQSACRAAAGIWKNVEFAHRLFPKTKVFVFEILPRGDNLTERSDTILKINRALHDGAVEFGYTLVGAYSDFQSACRYRTPCSLYALGNLHLSKEGYLLLGAIFKQVLAY